MGNIWKLKEIRNDIALLGMSLGDLRTKILTTTYKSIDSGARLSILEDLDKLRVENIKTCEKVNDILEFLEGK